MFIFSEASKTHISRLIEIKCYLDMQNTDNLKKSVSFSTHYEEPQIYMSCPQNVEIVIIPICENNSTVRNMLL